MATQASLLSERANPSRSQMRVYTICFFDRGLLVPRVTLIDAASDEEAVSEARSMSPWTRREVWDRHRPVATIRSTSLT